MENTLVLKIGDRKVGFKATAGIFYRYKQAFGSEYLEDVAKAHSIGNAYFVQQIEYRMLWVLAQTYACTNNEEPLPPVQDWLDSFEYGAFSVDDIYQKVQPILQANQKIDRKN